MVALLVSLAVERLPAPLLQVEPMTRLIACTVGYVLTRIASNVLQGLLAVGVGVALLRLALAALSSPAT